MEELRLIIDEAKQLAKKYRKLTGKPLGITGEVGEICVAELLGLELAEARCPGYDAMGKNGKRYQIKSRCILPGVKPGQRLSRITFDHQWDSVLLILLDEEFEPTKIYEADRGVIEEALKAPHSKSRNQRGALSVSKFKKISKCVWSRR